MRRSITSLALATIAVLLVTESVAAADPFGWRNSGSASGATTYRDGQSTSADWTPAGSQFFSSASTTPTATVHPTAAPAQTAHPAATPATAQTHRTQTVRSTSTPTGSHHSGNRVTSTQTTRHGSDWCDDYGRHDDHGTTWH